MARDVFSMTRPVLQQRKAALLGYLRDHRQRPVPAIELAGHLQIGAVGGDRETKRRKVRKIVSALRGDGFCVCAGFGAKGEGGYWLAEDDREWREYLEARRMGARFEFVTVLRMSEAARDKSAGQRMLFEEAKA